MSEKTFVVIAALCFSIAYYTIVPSLPLDRDACAPLFAHVETDEDLAQWEELCAHNYSTEVAQ